MNKWKHTLKLGDVWGEDWNNHDVQELGKLISSRIVKMLPDYEDTDKYGYDGTELVEFFKTISSYEEALITTEENGFDCSPMVEFNNLMSTLYDFCDKNKIWVDTH